MNTDTVPRSVGNRSKVRDVVASEDHKFRPGAPLDLLQSLEFSGPRKQDLNDHASFQHIQPPKFGELRQVQNPGVWAPLVTASPMESAGMGLILATNAFGKLQRT